MDNFIQEAITAVVGLAVIAMMVETFFPSVAALIKAYIFHLLKTLV